MQVEGWMQGEDWFLSSDRTRSWMRGEIEVSDADKKILRALGERLAAIAALPVQTETAANWRVLNRLGQVKPMVWINEIP